MPFILKIKGKTEQYRLFGSLPILCKSIGFDEKKEKGLSYIFSQKKELYPDDGGETYFHINKVQARVLIGYLQSLVDDM